MIEFREIYPIYDTCIQCQFMLYRPSWCNIEPGNIAPRNNCELDRTQGLSVHVIRSSTRIYVPHHRTPVREWCLLHDRFRFLPSRRVLSPNRASLSLQGAEVIVRPTHSLDAFTANQKNAEKPRLSSPRGNKQPRTPRTRAKKSLTIRKHRG